MFVDASIFVSVLNREPGWEISLTQLRESGRLYVSPIVRYETVIATSRARPNMRRLPTAVRTASEIVELLFQDLGVEEISITTEIGTGAVEVAAVYGKAVGHPADLNFGDCFAYACAKSLKVPLLYKGNDFAQTDLA